MLRPREADDDPQVVASRRVEHGGRRRRVRANRVDARCRHRGEVLLDAFRIGVLAAVGVRREGAVRYALDEKPPPVDLEELPVDPR